MEAFCEQCHNLVSGVYKTSCKTGHGIEEMFADIAKQLAEANRYFCYHSKAVRALFCPILLWGYYVVF